MILGDACIEAAGNLLLTKAKLALSNGGHGLLTFGAEIRPTISGGTTTRTHGLEVF
jgi:hypothetical protein